MIAAEPVAVVLLAAGLSSRFGARDKLSEPCGDALLGLHAARTFTSLPFAAKIVVTRSGSPDFDVFGFTPVLNTSPSTGQSGSIRLGVVQARLAKPEAILVALADMPLIPVVHIEALLARFDAQSSIVASTAGVTPGPPALFGARWFDTLETLSGDKGARRLLDDAVLVAAPASALIDVDTPADLAVIAVQSRI